MLDLKGLRDFRTDSIRMDILDSLDYAFRTSSPRKHVLEFLAHTGLRESGARVFVVGFGKAAKEMFLGAREYFGDGIQNSAVIVPEYENSDSGEKFLHGGHPIPTEGSLSSSLSLLRTLKELHEGDVVLVLISGGGSSLFEVLREGVTLGEYNRAVSCVMKEGANIYELNSIRYLYSEVKGGGFLKYTYPARVLSLIVSDVPGDDVDTVASGPTGNPPGPDRVTEALRKYGDLCHLPPMPERRVGQSSPCSNHIILRNRDFVDSVAERLKSRGYPVVNLDSGIQGSTKEVASLLLGKMRESYDELGKGFFIVGGGETSTMRIGSAKGGRNLELCLRILILLEGREEIHFASIGTDGMDGSSDAMGAIVDNQTLETLGKNRIMSHLSKSESLQPLLETKDVLFTGPTGTNLSDVFIAYYSKE
ncbi:MAG: glycerate kinase type-2 family protein [Thermoplasmata archaeon]